MVRNILPLVILAFVFFLQGLAPKVRTFRERQLQQVPPTPCTESWKAGESDGATPSPGSHTRGTLHRAKPGSLQQHGQRGRVIL